MAAKVIHFKKNGSSAPQKFVADDGGNNISAFLSSSRGNNIFAFLSSPRGAETIFLCFIVAVRRGNNILAVLSSPRSAGTIFLLFYRRRAARKRYFCRFIVAVQRGNNTFAILSSPCGAGTIFPLFQCLQCSCKYIPERFWRLQANCERSEMWREPRGDGGRPHAEGKMKSSHPKWNDCLLF